MGVSEDLGKKTQLQLVNHHFPSGKAMKMASYTGHTAFSDMPFYSANLDFDSQLKHDVWILF